MNKVWKFLVAFGGGILLAVTYFLVKKYVIADEAIWKVFEKYHEPIDDRRPRDFNEVAQGVLSSHEDEVAEQVEELNQLAKEAIRERFREAFGG